MATFQPWMDAPTPHNEAPSYSFVEPLSMPLNSSKADDSDEWEYEYSTTETETFYLTLDLTTPSIPTSRPSAPPRSGRVSTKSKWINPGLGRHKRQLERAPTISITDKDGDDAKSVESADEEALDPADEAAARNGDEHESEEYAEQKIQILELESDNPLISYRDHTFTCQWAKNVGSELLFAPHDAENPLPRLRHLPGNVDLLGACSARITSSTATVVPITHTKPLDLAPYEEGPLVESVSISASADRQNQARFLERLMGVKERKKEDDEVTVVAYKRMKFHGWVEMIQKKMEEERIELRERLRNPAERVEAEKRLNDLDELERNIPKDAPVPDDDDDDEPYTAPPVKRPKKRKDMLTEYAEEGSTKTKPRAVRRRPRRDWKRYNLDGSAATRPSAVNWQGVHTADASSEPWSEGNGHELVEEDAEGEEDDTPMHGVYGLVEQPGVYTEEGAQHLPGEHALNQEPEMAQTPAIDPNTDPELLMPPGGFTGLLEGDDIRHLHE